jgi:hypothetical protein
MYIYQLGKGNALRGTNGLYTQGYIRVTDLPTQHGLLSPATPSHEINFNDISLSLRASGCVTLWPCHLHEKSMYLKAKEEELWKLKYFTMQKYNLQKNLLKENQNPSRYYYNSIITNLKLEHNPKYHLSEILI